MESEQSQPDDNLAGVVGGLSSSAADLIVGGSAVVGLGGATLGSKKFLDGQRKKYSARMQDGDRYVTFDQSDKVMWRSPDPDSPNAKTTGSLEKYRSGEIGLTSVSHVSANDASPTGYTFNEYRFGNGATLHVTYGSDGRHLESRLSTPDGKQLTIDSGIGVLRTKVVYSDKSGHEEELPFGSDWVGEDGLSPFQAVLPQPDLSKSTSADTGGTSDTSKNPIEWDDNA